LLKQAAKELNINYSTAKTIIRIWRMENRIHKKYTPIKMKKRFRVLRGNESNSLKFELVIVRPNGFDILARQDRFYTKALETSFAIEKGLDVSTCASEGRQVEKNISKLIVLSFASLMHKSIEELELIQYGRILHMLVSVCKYLLLDTNILNTNTRKTLDNIICIYF
jgi:hypothetical protein